MSFKKSTWPITFEKSEDKNLPCWTIELPIYKCRLIIVNKTNSKKLDSLWGDCGNYGMMCRDRLDESRRVIITIKEYSDENLVHELHHAVDMIMSDIGHEKLRPCEPSAYLIGYLFKECLKIKRYLK